MASVGIDVVDVDGTGVVVIVDGLLDVEVDTARLAVGEQEASTTTSPVMGMMTHRLVLTISFTP